MKRPLILLALVVVLIAGAVLYLAASDSSDPVSVQDAARNAATTTTGTRVPRGGLQPRPGVYSYLGKGFDSITALGGSRHDFPRLVPVTVTSGSGQCEWSMRIEFVQQHVNTRHLCTGKTTLTDRGWKERIEFRGLVENQSFECGKDAHRARFDAEPGDTWSYRCTGAGKRTLDYEFTAHGNEELMIDGDPVTATHVSFTTKLKGETRGTNTADYWYAGSGLIVRWRERAELTSKTLIGDTKYTRDVDYELASLYPAGGSKRQAR